MISYLPLQNDIFRFFFSSLEWKKKTGTRTDIFDTLTKIENQAEKIQKSLTWSDFLPHPGFCSTRGKKKGKIPSYLPISEVHRQNYLLLPIKEKTFPPCPF